MVNLYDEQMLEDNIDLCYEFNRFLLRHKIELFFPWIAKAKGIEPIIDVGCGTGEMVREISWKFDGEIFGVDPDEERIEKAKHLAPRVKFRVGEFEELTWPIFRAIVSSHVLEHSKEPVRFLACCRNHLTSDGILIVSVPNALSLHKRLGDLLGLSTPYSLNTTDIATGHHHVFDHNKLSMMIQAAGFDIIYSRGLMLKPFPSAMMIEHFEEPLFEAFYQIGDDPVLRDYCASLMFVARPRR